VGAPVFRVAGDASALERIRALDSITLLVSGSAPHVVCLLALDLRDVDAFGATMRELAAAGAVERVEAEPHL
jgi:hypothetical protein